MSQYLSLGELNDMGFMAVGKNVNIHRSCNIVFPNNIILGNNIRIDGFSTIIGSGNIEIGNYVHISPYCLIAARGGVKFGDFSGISSGVRIYTTSDNYNGDYLTNPTVPEKYTDVHIDEVFIGKHVIIGSNSVILPGVHVGEGAAVGALTLVKSSLEPWGIYSGNPAQRIKDRKMGLLALERELLNDFL